MSNTVTPPERSGITMAGNSAAFDWPWRFSAKMEPGEESSSEAKWRCIRHATFTEVDEYRVAAHWEYIWDAVSIHIRNIVTAA